MSDNTSIEWSDATWSPLLGCDRVSPGCDNCYAIGQAHIRAANPHPRVAAAFAGLTKRTEHGIDWTGQINQLPDRLSQPLAWRKPRRVFVNSLSDLFHDKVEVDFIAQVFAVMSLATQHDFQLLTKRHGRMRSLLNNEDFVALVDEHRERLQPGRSAFIWPLPNLWLGVSAEDQKRADLRIPALLATPAAIRWVSAEPLLGPLDLTPYLGGNHGRADVPGRGRLSSGPAGGVGDRLHGAGVACGCSARRPLDGASQDDSLRTPEGGERHEQVPASPGDVQRHQIPRAGASAGLEALRRTDPRRHDDQPQERSASGQPTGEPGTRDSAGAGPACPRCAATGAARSVRGTEPHGEAVDGAGRGNLLAQSIGRDAGIDSSGLRGPDANDLADRPGRPAVSWIVAGGESGPGARPLHPSWARSLRDQCTTAGVPFLFKQHGAWIRRAEATEWVDAWTSDRVRWVAPDGSVHAHGDFNGSDEHRKWAQVQRVSKKAAGRELDGRTWDEYPETRAAVA